MLIDVISQECEIAKADKCAYLDTINVVLTVSPVVVSFGAVVCLCSCSYLATD